MTGRANHAPPAVRPQLSAQRSEPQLSEPRAQRSEPRAQLPESRPFPDPGGVALLYFRTLVT